MGRQSKQKACFACVKAKRCCDKTLPSCSRCLDKEVECVYQRRRLQPGGTGLHTALDLIHGDPQASSSRLRDQGIVPIVQTGTEAHSGLFIHPAASTGLVCEISSSFSPPIQSSEIPSSRSLEVLSADQLTSYPRDLGWFLQPSAWTVGNHYQPPDTMPTGPVFSNFIRGLQSWLSRFFRTGHNPFIHRHVYGSSMPQCMQDAYSAISISQNITQDNEHIIDDICSNHISKLMTCQPVDGELALLPLLSTRDHLARTQSLLIHLLLALFSPSIPRRARAETLISTLIQWANQLWESASRDATAALMYPNFLPLINGDGAYTTDTVSGLYHTFALSETIRRTWLLCRIATGVYYGHRGEWFDSAACAGDTHITTRAKIWDANSPASWEALVHQQDPLFIYSLHGQSLVRRGVEASQVDEFARHLFTMMWGMDKVEDWVVRTGGSVKIRY
ncbi:hypothetical protein B0J13DRAFT_677616 [Dactylonectria estremocensis]|uniref:Zn(2)-C6 fungal-type domain-containing protein n=1 Tax=Dactylonectria estremocensis TaxID=1079267 RepID=A0A9P9EHN2_9HYPO|nr:hypothetical protein B0J13DRAFT_677616 [Dactylonectria estremocensis]